MIPDFAKAYATNDTFALFMRPILDSGVFDGTISEQQFSELMRCSGLNDLDTRLAMLPYAAQYAVVPISKFYVGALVRGTSGKIYFGANIEFTNVQMGQTVHAEQSAISHAWMKGETGVRDITINYSPCGHCRQFMNELNGADLIRIQLPNTAEKLLHDYLPESFGPSDLGITSKLMSEVQHGYLLDNSTCDMKPEGNDMPIDLTMAALAALNMSHSPYSHSHSGVSIKMDDGSIYKGAYAENAAFNPSLNPLQVALIQVQMAGKDFGHIQSVVLVEKRESNMCQYDTTLSCVRSIAKASGMVIPVVCVTF